MKLDKEFQLRKALRDGHLDPDTINLDQNSPRILENNLLDN